MALRPLRRPRTTRQAMPDRRRKAAARIPFRTPGTAPLIACVALLAILSSMIGATRSEAAASGTDRVAENDAPLPRPTAATLFTSAAQQTASPQASPTPHQRPRTVTERYAETQDAGETKPQATDEQDPLELGDDEVLRVDSNLVLIPASVLDNRGRAVTDLKLEDFELRVDGEVQTINDLSRAESPVHIALLFDNSASLSAAREFEKQAAVRFFRALIRPIDRAAIYAFSTNTTLAQPLTNDVNRLVSTIERFGKPEGATALFDTVAEAAEYMRGVAGRKVLVIVSDGTDTVSDISFEESVRLALRAECQVYVVQTRQVEEPHLRDPISDERMQKLTEQTGGAVFIPQSIEELDTVFTQIALDLSQQYLLSYYPQQVRRDNYFRFISLRVKSRPHLRIRARKGFYPHAANSNLPPPDEAQRTTTAAASNPTQRPAGSSTAIPRQQTIHDQSRRIGPTAHDEEESARRRPTAEPSTSMTVRIADAALPASGIAHVAAAQPAPTPTPIPTPMPTPTPAAPEPTPQPSPRPAAQPTPSPESADTTKPRERSAEPVARQQVSNLTSRAVSLPKPIYPATAKQAGISGVVVVEVTVDENGKVMDARAISGPALLYSSAMNAARQARFSPLTVSGRRASMRGTISYNFIR